MEEKWGVEGEVRHVAKDESEGEERLCKDPRGEVKESTPDEVRESQRKKKLIRYGMKDKTKGVRKRRVS